MFKVVHIQLSLKHFQEFFLIKNPVTLIPVCRHRGCLEEFYGKPDKFNTSIQSTLQTELKCIELFQIKEH